MSAVVHRISNGPPDLMFYCPGCKTHHGVSVDRPGSWTWNHDMEKPTIEPSIFVNSGRSCPDVPACHSFVRNGEIQFLGDCSHELAGKTVALEATDL
jgi:hypothetical protein